jgi:hypothetical protein
MLTPASRAATIVIQIRLMTGDRRDILNLFYQPHNRIENLTIIHQSDLSPHLFNQGSSAADCP